MPKRIKPDDYKDILDAVRQHPEGASFEMIQASLGDGTARRTLQRRLSELVQQGRLAVEGRTRGALYRRIPESHVIRKAGGIPSGEALGQPSVESIIPVSDEGSRLRKRVRRPIAQRSPAGYRREFLTDYLPNETWYLPSKTRKRLRELGETPAADRPAGTYARDMLDRLLIDLSWASSRLEGNTYTRLDTERLIEHGEVAAGKDARETQMILNHKRAIEFLVEGAEEVGFNAYSFRNVHALLSENLLADPAACGQLRTRAVEIPQQIEEFFRLILEKTGAIADPFEQAFFLMVHIPYLQPFEDVNKRVSRLGANISLLKHNLCPLVLH
jgi:hypothetical protein